MKTFNHLTIIICAFVLMTFTNCEKTAGPKGDKGDTGASGTSNITSSTYTTSAATWTAVSWPTNYQQAAFNVSAITSNVMSKGSVQVFLGDGTGSNWKALPYSSFNTNTTYDFSVGVLNIDVALNNNTMPVNPGVLEYKVVVIPGFVIKTNPNVNWNNYGELKTKFNLQD